MAYISDGIGIRPATGDDSRALRHLAQLDSSTVPPDPVLVASVRDEPVAAISLSNDAIVADPFQRTAEAVVLLRTRASQLRASASPQRATLRRRLLDRGGAALRSARSLRPDLG